VLVLGLTFKENCPDVRNTKVVDIVTALRGYHAQVDVYDPWIDRDEARHEYGLECLPALPTASATHDSPHDSPQGAGYAAIVLAVGHREFVALGEAGIKALGQPGAVVYDVKGILPLGAADGRL
jgi:UDP-N-acetyl-D-galactosamine dehydrogenase